MPRLPWQSPPAPPPAAPTLALPPVTLSIYAVILATLLLAKFGHIVQNPNRLDSLWLVWPIGTVIFSVAHRELSTGYANWKELENPAHSLVYALPIAGFALLLISEMVTWLFSCLGPRRAFAPLRHPVMCVHMISLTYYWCEPTVQDLPLDAFGRPLHPLRYIMWTISVSSMCFSLYLVTTNVLQPKEQRTAQELRSMLIDSLIGCYLTFVLGFLGSFVKVRDMPARLTPPPCARVFCGRDLTACDWLAQIDGNVTPNVLLFCLSSLGFYLMLLRLTSMLRKVYRDERVIRRGMAAQFQAISFAVTFVWHIFPVIWLLGAFNLISIFEEHIGYILCDLCAKYLLLFVYTNHVNA